MTIRGLLRTLVAIIVFAVTRPTFAVHVRVMLQRPKCDLADAVVEVYNRDPALWVKVKVEGTVKNAYPGPQACVPSYTPCVGSFTGDEITLPPCHKNNFCQFPAAFLPNCTGCDGVCGRTSCDNRSVAGTGWCSGNCPVTCGTNDEWCTELVDFRVTVLSTSTDGTVWTPVNSVVCAKGIYGSIPCDEESYCTDHASLPGACTFNNWNLVCLQHD